MALLFDKEKRWFFLKCFVIYFFVTKTNITPFE